MNSRKRIELAFNNEKVDRVPIGFWRHFVLGPDQFKGLEEPQILEEAFNGHQAFYELIKPDMMKIMNEGFFGYPPIMDNPLETGEDLLRIKAIGASHPWITEQIKHVKRISAEFKEDVACFYNVFAPLQVIRIRFDFLDHEFDKFVQLAEQYPDELKAAGMEIQKDIDALVQGLFDAEAIDGIYYCVQNIQSASYDQQRYHEIIAPTEKEVLENANRRNDFNILHVCGYAHHVNDLAIYKEYRAKVYNWAVHTENVSLTEGKELFDGKCVLGGFDNNPDTVIDSASEEELEAYTKQLLVDNEFNGFVLGADCSLPEGQDDNRLRKIREIVEKTI